ncbi:hypothetical protein M0654_03795 [Rhizobium sp. NTR19]|uniref:DUF6894 domain-containing protein n=1 Tax=Neorhizobium turbinariae TaxID=2937795 RepID=A0ABT0IMM6_9HYPH|nr:hypothetical protein [Neorhizobium turbinariae]MCK8779103.1 hypothetical protein [Neorhizobium turbinariae]
MPRYYFHIRSGGALQADIDGIDLPTHTAALEEAILGAREMVADRVRNGEEIGNEQFEVVDEDGKTIHVLPFRSVIRLRDCPSK